MIVDIMAATAPRFPWYEEPYWRELCARAEALARDEGDDVARASVYFELFSHVLLFAVTPFLRVAMGRDVDPDSWLSARPGLEASAAAAEASAPLANLGYRAVLQRNRQIVAQTLELIDERSAGASLATRTSVEAVRARLTYRDCPPACPRKLTGQAIRGERSRELGHEPTRGQRDRHLQHPLDEWFRVTRPRIGDNALLALFDAWIDDLEVNYRELASSIPGDCVDHAELDFEAEAPAGEVRALEITGLSSPIQMYVVERTKGESAAVEAIATHKVVVDQQLFPQPDGIAVLPGQRWRIRGHRLNDGTVMPCWGTHRLRASCTRATSIPGHEDRK